MNILGANRVTRSGDWLLLIVVIVLALVGLMSQPARAQTTSTWSGGSGNWAPCPGQGGTALWNTCSTGVYPDGNFNAVILGGPVFATGASVVNLSIAAGDVLNLNPGSLAITGSSLFNQGTINIGASNGLQFAQPSQTTTISGSGTINFTNPNSRLLGGQIAVVNQDNPIQGQGYIGVGPFTNHSLINANVPSGALLLHSGGAVGFTNTGTVEASNGGILQLFASSLGVPLNNSGGIIQALAGSTVAVDGYAISGGTLISVGSGMFTTLGGSGNPSLSNLTNKANYLIVDAGSTTIAGTITNQGTIQVKGALFINGNATLNGGSVAISAPSGAVGSLSGAATLINGSNIAGSGVIGDANLTLANHGTINATDTANPLVFGGHQFSNSATLEASNGGKLQIQNAIDNTGGTIQALNGSTVLITTNTGMVSGGTLTTGGTGVLDSNSGTLDGTTNVVTNAGLFRITQGNLFLQGTINNTGTIVQNTAGDFIILNQPTVLEGSGNLVLLPGTAILGSSTTPLINKSTIEGAGNIGSNEMGIVNDGTILANSAKNPKTLTIAPDATVGFTNNGKLIVNKGNVLTIAGPFNNVSSTTLSGGTYMLTGTLEWQGAIATNAANITLTGTTGQ